MVSTKVFNLKNGKFEAQFTLQARPAVIAAHAQSLGDFNTWDYDKMYGHLVQKGKYCITCGDYTAQLN